MSYVQPVIRARLVANGFAAPWTLFPFALVVVLVSLNIVGSAIWKWSTSSLLAIGDPISAVVLLLVWYFWIGRIADRIRLRKTRLEVPDAIITTSARTTRSLLIWFAEVRRVSGGSMPSSWGAVLVATKSDLQFWMTVGGESAPVGTLDWREIESVRVDHSSPSRILLRRAGDTADMSFKAVNEGWFRPILSRGAARSRLVTRLGALRAG